MSHIKGIKRLFFGIILVSLCAGLTLAGVWIKAAGAVSAPVDVDAPKEASYVVLAWNDLGMHCYNRDFKDLAVLPPFNTLWAQVIQVGDPPKIVTTGVKVEYFFADNTYSVGKSNFWDYDLQLFGVDLPANVGLKNFGLSGTMTLSVDHFQAVGIPLTEFSYSAPTIPDPYQLATVVVRDAVSGVELARTHPVAPVSTEMHCDNCHSDNGEGNEGIATGVVEQNILTKHDQENMDDYPAGHQGALMDRRPILCAECHSSNALEAAGVAEVPNLSKAMHEKHSEEGLPSTLEGCYNCHPGPTTRCLRDVMSSQYNLACDDCHGTLLKVSQNPNPWLNEPRCDNALCHGSVYQQDQALYRMSKEHGGVYCEGCHDSTHAIALSSEPKDAIKFIGWQGHAGTLDTCTVCHATQPAGPGPHNLPAPTPKTNTTTTITAHTPNPSQVGQVVTVTFTVSAEGGTPTGNVSVTAGEPSCNSALTNGSGNCTITFTSAGPYTLTAIYSGDDSFNGSVSAAVTHTVASQLSFTSYLPIISR